MRGGHKMNIEEMKKLSKKYDTPLYVFDISMVKERVELIRDMLPAQTKLCYAVKANPFLITYIYRLVDRLEVCSPGEYEICIRNNVPPDMIVVSGVSKTYDQMKRVFSYSQGRGHYTVESKENYRVLKKCADESGVKINVLLRLSANNQFGMDEETFCEVLKQIIQDDNMELSGIHYYAGTQKKAKKFLSELDYLEQFAKGLSDEYGIEIAELEYGPGLMVSYFANETDKAKDEAKPNEQLCILSERLRLLDGYDFLTIELGRFLVSECGYYFTHITDVKQTGDTGYLIVDGGIHQLNYYGWMMGMKQPYVKQPHKREGVGYGKWTICGSLCTVNDVLARDVDLSEPVIGDVLVFEKCGAYSVTEGMALFLSRELPQILVIDDDRKVTKLRGIIQTNILNSEMEE